MKVVLLGSHRMVMGFLLGGIHEGYVCENSDDSKKRLEECLMEPGIGILLISQSVAEMIPDRVQAARTSPRMIPVVAVIPDEMKKPDTCGE